MIWQRQGLIASNTKFGGKDSRLMLPTPIKISENILRIFVGACDENNVGRIKFIDVDAKNPQKIINAPNKIILDIGEDGAFDDNGVVPISIVRDGDKILLYYIGFQLGVKAPYYMFCGLAISYDNGESFTRYSKSPILDRAHDDLFARCGVNVIKDGNKFKMWYIGSYKEGWVEKDGKKLPLYTMKYLESKDGLDWGNKSGVKCLDFKNDDEHGFGRPFVYKDGEKYKMFYSIRTYLSGYQIGYAESSNGISWQRLDEKFIIDKSQEKWDDESISYPFLIFNDSETLMLYNGNGYGKTGFGFAKLQKNDK